MIKRESVIHLTGDDAAFLVDLVESPPVRNARLRRAFRNYKSANAGAGRSISALKPRSKPVRQRDR